MKLLYLGNLFSCLVFLFSGFPGKAQLYNNGSRMSVKDGAVLTVSGSDLIIRDSSVYNSGKILVLGNCEIRTGSRIITGNDDSLIVVGNFYDGSASGQRSGVLVLAGTNQTIAGKTHLYHTIVITGGGSKTVTDTVFVASRLSLHKGYIIVPSSGLLLTDSTATVVQTGTATNSFVVGRLLRKMNDASDSLYFPIGSTASEFRPVTVLGLKQLPGRKPVFSASTYNASPQPGAEVGVIYNRIWEVKPDITDYSYTGIRLGYSLSEVSSAPVQNLVVAQSESPTGKFNSLGRLESMTGTIRSELKPGQGVYALGSSGNIKGNFKVFLEGPFNGSSMHTELLSSSALDSALISAPMLPGYTIPSDAVDRISFILKSGAVYPDTAYAWLLSDGTIRDYNSGTREYVVFPKANAGTSYYVIASHRNHLPVSSGPLMLTGSATKNIYNYDYTSSVWGGGALYDLLSNKWMMYAADSYRTSRNQTDVLDLIRVGTDINRYVTGTGLYRNSDVNLDGKVNSADYQLSADHNNRLYFSTLP